MLSSFTKSARTSGSLFLRSRPALGGFYNPTWQTGHEGTTSASQTTGGWKVPHPKDPPCFDNQDLFPNAVTGHSQGFVPMADGSAVPRNLLLAQRLEAMGEKKTLPKVFIEEEGGIKSMTYDYSTPPAAFAEHAGGNEGVHENMIDIFRVQNTLKEPAFLGISTYKGLIGVFFFNGVVLWMWNVMDFGREVAVLTW